MSRPYTLKIFLPDGEPDGIRFVTKSGWVGCGLVVPRPLLARTKHREEFDRPGVYVLIGPAESGGLPTIYVGEGSPVKSRLESHFNSRDFWVNCVFFTANDGSLNKAHIQHLESRLVGLAKGAKRCILDNAQLPAEPVLTESERADSENFLDEMLRILPIVGFSVFENPTELHGAGVEANPRLELHAKGITACGHESNAGFVVLKASAAVPDSKITPSCPKSVVGFRGALLASGVLATRSGTDELVFTQDYEFTSPSYAASVIKGASTNGRVEWQDATGRSLRDLQDDATGQP